MFSFAPDILISALVSFFVIVDPVGSAAIFASLSKNMSEPEKRKTAIKAVTIAIGIIVVFALIGEALLSRMGVSIAAFRVAGGLLLFVTAFRMIMGFHDPDQLESERANYKRDEDIAVFPMSIPILAGPGVLTTALIFVTTSEQPSDYAYIFGAAIAIQLLALTCLLLSSKVVSFFGQTGNGIISRVMGILLAAMSIQFIADGVSTLLHLEDLIPS